MIQLWEPGPLPAGLLQTCELLSQQRQLQIIAGEKGERKLRCGEEREVGDSRFCHKNCRTGREGRRRIRPKGKSQRLNERLELSRRQRAAEDLEKEGAWSMKEV